MDTPERARGRDFLEGRTPVQVVTELVRDVGREAGSRDRVALASTFSHGEGAWVSEVAWQAAQRGLHVGREARVGGAVRVDLEVAGTAVEFKSTFGAWSLTPGGESEREAWLGADIDKLASGRSPGVVVVTVAALTMGVAHQRAGFKVEYGEPAYGALTPQAVLERGVRAVQEVVGARCVRVARVDLPAGVVPPHGGSVLLSALVGAVNVQACRL